jgi:heptosyltransferase I
VRVLIVKTSSMGDVVHALPMVTDIARAFPHARVDWVVEEAFAELPHLHPAITRVLPVAMRRWRRAAFEARSWRELVAARRAIRQTRYHAVIDCQGLVKSAVIARSAKGPVSGYARRSAREGGAALFYDHRFAVDLERHAIDRMRELGARALGYALDGPEDFAIRARAAQMRVDPPFNEDGAVLLLTNASRASKLWPDEHWSRLENTLAKSGLLSWLAWGSDAEREACAQRARRMHSARVLPRATLAQIASLASRAALVVGLDTGLTHLAAAVGAPTVGIFCDFDPRRVGLRGNGPVVSLGGVDQTPGVEEVVAAVETVLAGAKAQVR